ncbi:MAG: hypothetical protein ACI4TM_06870 [Candidatus Cryptobacteroides sp.]
MNFELEEAVLVSAENTSGLKGRMTEGMTLDRSIIDKMPKFLGSADPMGLMKFLPGVQTVTEYESGIHICGCENSHNDISVAGVPVFGVTHLFGFFSAFNPSHYPEITFSISPDLSTNRLGGTIRMELPDSASRSISGDVSVGIMAAQGTLRLKGKKKVWASLSARQSFLNLLYGPWLKLEGDPIKYGFGDYNATIGFAGSSDDMVTFDFYFGRDKASIHEPNLGSDISFWWGNAFAACHWNHEGGNWKMNNSLFFSGYMSDMNLIQEDLTLSLPTHIGTIGYKGDYSNRWIRTHTEVSLYETLPQSPELDGSFGSNSLRQKKQRGLDANMSVLYDTLFVSGLGIHAGLKAGIFVDPEQKCHPQVSPEFALSYSFGRYGKAAFHTGWYHQNLFQTGLSNVGLPVDFWFLAGNYSKPQSSLHFDVGYDVGLLNDALKLSADLYFKKLFNQVEYRGTLFDFLNASYRTEDYLLKGNGMNFGLNMMLQKTSGNVTGWIAYSFGRALRRFDNPDYPGIYPSSHERLHELNAVCSYSIGRCDISGTFVYASGSPFTVPEYFYISSGSIVTQYGEYNGGRMRPYIRLDLSLNVRFIKDERQENGINLSLYNALGRWNDVIYKMTFSEENGKYAFRPMSFFLRFVPSVSYYHRF